MIAFGKLTEVFARQCWFPALCSLVVTASAAEPASLKPVKTIPLPDVVGRFDHFSSDVKGRRLFVAALGNNTVEVLDLDTGKRSRSITGCDKPQGVLFLEKANMLFVANGGNGKLRAYDCAKFDPLAMVGSLDDADNVRYDGKLDRVYVGYGDGALGVINPATGVQLASIKLPGHPESFQIERDGGRIFVNVPEARQVAVIDGQAKTVSKAWSLPDAKANFPMALDETDRRLFVGCRNPPRLAVLDTTAGKVVSDVVIVGDTDDLFYDAKRKRIYVSGGEGFVDVIEQRDADNYKLLERIPTAPGARTSFFSPELDQFYLAVPRRGGQGAEIRVYEIGK
ncbi:MAG TPA: YncE family protein [Candidatus Angelobacter sp.]|nr:YncE family protein [Candidatus Angelobacter sp.]